MTTILRASGVQPATATSWPIWLRSRCLVLVLAGACLAAGCAAPPAPAGESGSAVAAGIVSVTTADAARFDQGRAGGHESEAARRAWVDALSLHLAERAAPLLGPDRQLEVHITDIRRAGDFEPWRGPQAADVRIVRDIYPPRIDLHFKLLSSDGKLLREASRQLRDPSFMMRPDLYPNDPLRYEKTLLDDWLRSELGPQR
ncbi:MAG: DUF3016 domain-containing protein [Burkholderiaceae bacterium]|jgi:hypothetical protein|nr:DUF3016 domain-containing protein [Burkholderiaceae bacterium]